MAKKAKTLVLLDGNAIIHRAYHALPPLTTKKGELVNAVYGFAMTLLSVLEKFKPDYIAASFDLKGPTFRHTRYAEYKATRVKAPDDLYAQIPRVKEVTASFNIPIYEKVGFEADDCVGTLAAQAAKSGVETIIVTGDMDTLQLVTPHTKVFTMRKGFKDTVLYDEAGVMEKYGLKPNQIADFKGLAGDASDNIPGVKGIGAKTASDLLKEYKDLEGVYAALDKIKPSVAEKLEREKKNAFLSRELGRIDCACPVTLSLKDSMTADFDRDRVAELFKELEFFSLVKRLPGGQAESRISNLESRKEKLLKVGKKAAALKTKEEAEKLLKGLDEREAAVWAKRNEGSLFGTNIESLEVAQSMDESTTILWNDETREAIRNFFEDEKIRKIAYDAKEMMHLLAKERIAFAGLSFDVLIAAYLLHSGSDVELSTLALAAFGDEELARPAATIFGLREKFEADLKSVSSQQQKDANILRVFKQIEMPLIPVLFRMERAGIRLNGKKLQDLSAEMTDELSKIEKEVYKFAGKEFNISSPKQLQDILFVDLKIPTANIKKIKTGISTASSELEKLREYPIVSLIEQYRELSKLKNTYLDVLPTLCDEHSRVHSNFRQAVAATGRLSSTDPNLQNIPARSAWSEKIRGAFEAAPGNALVGADYSQIELRIAAHLSGDKHLIAAFQNGEDVHRATAAVVFKVKPEVVTSDMRRKAKAFNFGILYGMSAYGLSAAADMTQEEAAKFIAEYFKKFSGVREFLERLKTFAHEKGYVETALGRRRYIPEINHTNEQVKRGAERMAINMPVQGLAADIMKVAMLKVQGLLDDGFADSAQAVLQVHDELIFEVKEKEAKKFAEKVKTCMEEVYALKVPLVAEVSIGKNWGEI